MQPTQEQQHAVNLSLTGENLKIEAYAGAGKTSTLSAISNAMPNKNILYIAFNKSIAEEAKTKFPKNVTCKTTHSLAYSAVGHNYSKRLGFFKADRAFGWTFQESIILSKALELFCQSSDEVITAKHFPPLPDDFKTNLDLPKAANIWFNLLEQNGTVTHDYYMKRWQLTNPVLHYEVILMDEAQDSNPLLLDVLSKQKCQVIYVGDRYQKLYAFRGAVDGMTDIKTKNVSYITQSFRFNSIIAEVANKILPSDVVTPLLGFDKVQSELVTVNTYPYAVICRTNAGVLDSVIRISELGKRVHVTGGVKDQQDQIQAIYDIANGITPSYFEFKRFKTIENLKRFANSDAGTMFAPIVNYCIKRGISAIPMLLKNLRNVHPSEEGADVICTTVHKAKGREFDHVTIYNDMIATNDAKWTEDERCVLYVAVTRAKKQLNISRCDAIKTYNDSW
jgi:superfamily I DNA/RNA helicase